MVSHFHMPKSVFFQIAIDHTSRAYLSSGNDIVMTHVLLLPDIDIPYTPYQVVSLPTPVICRDDISSTCHNPHVSLAPFPFLFSVPSECVRAEQCLPVIQYQTSSEHPIPSTYQVPTSDGRYHPSKCRREQIIK